MPKKKNFLGGMQNYNPNTGEYEPALKGPNGESPSNFKSFKKGDDDSFESTNKKRMGKVEDAQEFHEREVREGKEKWEKNATPLQKWHSTQDYRDKHNELAEKHNKGEITEEELFDGLKKLDDDFEKGESVDYNAKRMGKETPKNNKSSERKDKYGNPLLSDDAFKVGQKAAQEYLDQLNNGEGFEKAKGSFVTLGGFQDAISDALEQAGYNQDYDLTYQDLNEIVGSVTGEEVDFEDYEGNGKGWTGKKYNGYVPKDNALEEKATPTKPLTDEDAQKLMKEGSSRALTEDEKKQLKEYYTNQMKKYGL